MPRYEYSEGTSNKFWEIELSGASYVTKWGRIGAGSVSSSTKQHPDAAKAKKEYDKLVQEKLKKGYVLVGGGKAKSATKAKPPETKAASRNAELEKAIVAKPDDADAYLVYADWLQTQGDPRGELIVLQHAGKTKQANALLAKHAEHFLGPFATAKPETWELEWQHGFVRKARIGWPAFEWGMDDDAEGAGPRVADDDDLEWGERAGQQLAMFLRLASAAFVQELELGPLPGDEEMNLGYLAEAIDQVGMPALRKLVLGQIGEWDISGTATAMPASKAVPNLREVTLRGGSPTIGKVELPELRSFRVETGTLNDKELRNIAAAKWPKLERLEIWFGDPNYGASGKPKDIQPILDGTGLGKLQHLGLRNCPFADELVKVLVGSKILKQLKTLDLSMGNLSDRGVQTLVDAKPKLAHLSHLNLDDNALTDASKPRLKGLAKKVEFGSRHSPDRAVARGEDRRWYRFVSVGE
ncbi:MAG TPA: WGR domain-containing protein [Kofleriaceae bacterium]|nr:WGR domain-containing protein [Kofleriaceae bacterium]